jgi:formylglycine-generating enzyme required for sulfatase activity
MEPKTLPAGPPIAGDSAVPAEVPTIILGEFDGGRSASADHEAPVAPGVGDVLGQRYHLIELIGEGGMSHVYKAIDSQRHVKATAAMGDNYVAVKVLARPFNEDMAALAALQDEITRLRNLAHPNIVRLFSCDRDEATVFITMEYLVGRSLYTRLHPRSVSGRPSPAIDRDEAESIITAVGGALEFAHQNLVVHGDLKPGNVFITEVGEIKVIDFGVASWNLRPRTALERREAAQRRPMSAVTPRYASPQLMARHKPETTDDIYALACLAYELMTGAHPFDDGNGTQAFPPPLRAGLTPPQYLAITRGLQLEKRNRTPTVRQFLDDFAAPVARRDWRVGTLAAAVAACALLGGAAWFYLHRPATPERPEAPETPGSDLSHAAPPAGTRAPSAASTPVLPGTVIRDCATCPQMTVLPTGSFEQGSEGSSASPFEKPRHRVAIAYSLAMANRDVTVGDFREFVSATGRDMKGCDIYDGAWRHKAKSSWKEPGFAQTDAHPVTCASWDDAVAYATWLSTKTGHRYRLPSASEWEYAARAGSVGARPWSTDPAAACANANVADQSAARHYPGWDVFACDDGYVHTAPVSTYKSNAFGLDDMLGNVFQWTMDCWHADYAGAPTDGTARLGEACSEREMRGGSWFSAPDYVRSAYRNHFPADYRASSVGFRLVREGTP